MGFHRVKLLGKPMSDTVNDLSGDVVDVDVVTQIVRDPEIRKLPAGSDEYKAAVEKLSTGKKTTEATAAAKGDDQASTETTGEDDETKPKKKGLERRFSELTSERDEARRKAEALEARLADLETKAQAKSSEQEVQFSGQDFPQPKPVVEKFDTYAEYVEALSDWKADKRDFDREQTQIVRQAQEKQKEVVGSWETREKATKDRVEGYDQLVDRDFVQTFTTKTASREAMMYMLESDNGPDLLYELAEDEAKLAGFKSMSPVKQVAYLSRLDMKFEKTAEGNTQKTTVSKAPAPSKDLPKGKTVSTKTIDPSQGFKDNAEYRAWRASQKKK
jgi:hypothetical protein